MCKHSTHMIWIGQNLATPWTRVCKSLLFMEFFRHEYWSGLSFPPRRSLPNPCLMRLLHWQVDCLPLGMFGKPQTFYLGKVKWPERLTVFKVFPLHCTFLVIERSTLSLHRILCLAYNTCRYLILLISSKIKIHLIHSSFLSVFKFVTCLAGV